MNNLYIIDNILSDWTPGMAVISAPSLERCKELFIKEFVHDSHDEKYKLPEYDTAIKENDYQLIENVNHPEGIISYVFGGS